MKELLIKELAEIFAPVKDIKNERDDKLITIPESVLKAAIQIGFNLGKHVQKEKIIKKVKTIKRKTGGQRKS